MKALQKCKDQVCILMLLVMTLSSTFYACSDNDDDNLDGDVKGVTNEDGSVSRQIGKNGTFYKTWIYEEINDGLIWMVENSREGEPVAISFNNNVNLVNGYYYTWRRASTACPEGWRLPTRSEFARLADYVENHKNARGSLWWNNERYGAYAGCADEGDWGSERFDNYGAWWTSSESQYFESQDGELDGPNTSSGRWFSVRCVCER